MQEVGGSIPPGSTNPFKKPPLEAAFLLPWSGHQPFVSWKGRSSSFLVEPP
jgi:hypothetical protein